MFGTFSCLWAFMPAFRSFTALIARLNPWWLQRTFALTSSGCGRRSEVLHVTLSIDNFSFSSVIHWKETSEAYEGKEPAGSHAAAIPINNILTPKLGCTLRKYESTGAIRHCLTASLDFTWNSTRSVDAGGGPMVERSYPIGSSCLRHIQPRSGYIDAEYSALC